jgi:predicted TIM-barrel fold metal-dependent hydrolase
VASREHPLPNIVDSQIHVWGADTAQRPWPGRGTHAHRDTPYGAAEVIARMDEAGVDAAVLVPPSWEGDRNDLALAAARDYPGRFAVMGRLDPEAPGAREAVAEWKSQPAMLGLRFIFHTELLRNPFLEGRYDWVWDEAEGADVPVMMLLHHAYLEHLDAIARRHPKLRLAVDHLGLVSGEKDAHAFRDLDKLLALARHANVAVKASALPCYSADAYPYRALHPYVRRVVDAFGPRRVFWGSDMTRLPCTYRESVTMWTDEMPWLAPADLEWIMGRALRAWLGWTTQE